ncbi:MAG: formate acetyltransferase [Desulfobacteraceae bacterium]|nr:formate acetyltransferase [Desulfobacteraceae bacterium]MBC2757359.1 formate acetyltransferase [Desulfobacteraceae bacterium]
MEKKGTEMEVSANTFKNNAKGKRRSHRFERIKKELLSFQTYLCPERACLVTDYFKKHDASTDPMVIRKAKALRHIFTHKSVAIYPDELIVGNMGSRRISALIQPELAGIFMSEELLWIDKRKTTPFQSPWSDRLKLLFRVYPYWFTRNLAFRSFFPHIFRLIRYAADQLNAKYYLIHEAGGIGHFLPNYEKMLKLGVKGYMKAMEKKEDDLHKATRITCEGLVAFATRMAQEAERLAAEEKDEVRVKELVEIARICRKVPLEPADTFHEALQSLWLTHMGVNLEGINSAISFGRMDQYLYPYYKRDMEEGRMNPERARELLLCFSAKATEHVFLLSERTSQYHGGFLVVQAAIVGGMDQSGKDAVNDLTYVFLDVMEESGLRDPNYQARIHPDSPEDYLKRVVDMARKEGGVPALFNDKATIAALTHHGYPLQEARNYAVVGCVEPALPGKSFFSTDAGLFNLPICLELALNSGKRFNGRGRVGVATPDPKSFNSIDQVIEAFRVQVDHMVAQMIGYQQMIEKGNRDYHPTPLSSLLVDGCIESGKDVTAGGAMYNSSGIQGIGVADVADSLAAIEDVVFKRRKYTMSDVLKVLFTNFSSNPKIQAELRNAPKYGNDHAMPDGYADLTVRIFHTALAGHRNTRGGPYVPGFYSVTSHVAFGKYVGALPSGRQAGEPLASSLGPGNGNDRLGPTAVLNSVAHVDSTLAPNGYALNLRFDSNTLAGDRGIDIMGALVKGYFDSGGMEMQVNVLDPEMLEEARTEPGKYPGLVVRVAGYCAYFDDLHDSAKQEIINRTRLEV